MDGQNIELKPSKKIIYLDQNLISEIVNNHNAGRDGFFSILYDKLMNAILAEKIVCPFSCHHIWESALGGEAGKAYQDMAWKMSYGIEFLIPCEIEDNQIFNSVQKYCRKDQNLDHDFAWEQAFCSNPYRPLESHVQVDIQVPEFMERLKQQKDQYAKSIQRVYDTWPTESASFDESLSIEKKAHVEMIIKLGLFEEPEFIGEWPWDTKTREILRHQQMLLFVQRLLIANSVLDPMMVIDFFRSEYFSRTPYFHIGASIYAGPAIEMRKLKEARRAKPSDRLDIEIISHYLPYCDAMFIDRAFQYLLSDVLKFDNRYSVEIFSMKDKERFLSFVEGFL